MSNNAIVEVSELNEYIKSLIGGDPALASVGVRGELSNYKVYPSGHHYFTMKDRTGALRCVMFKGAAGKLRFTPESGMKVVALGRVEVYVRDGAYQFYVSSLTPDGVGDLHAEYERLKEMLRREGLFDEQHKKPIPTMPGRIAVITSGAGAAVRDVIRVLGSRWPLAKVIVLPVRVQGVEAPAEIVGALRYCNRHNIADVIITGRGGGSIEDLWAFNDERVVRAIFDSDIPVISAVGHEPDVTISDFVADRRAATPSNAAEIAVPDAEDVRGALNFYDTSVRRASRRTLEMFRTRLDAAAQSAIMRSPRIYLDGRRIEVDRAGERLEASVRRGVSDGRAKFAAMAASLDAMSPLKVLGRGYAIARGADGSVVSSAADVKSGDKLVIRLKSDEIDCTVD